MTRWENNTFGVAGKFYPLLYVAPFPILGASIFLIGYSLMDGFQFVERVIIAGFGLFFLVYFIKALDAIRISRATIQVICQYESYYTVRTFSGKYFRVDNFDEISEDKKFFSKKNINFLFPSNARNTIVRCELGEFYLSGTINGIDALRKSLISTVARQRGNRRKNGEYPT